MSAISLGCTLARNVALCALIAILIAADTGTAIAAAPDVAREGGVGEPDWISMLSALLGGLALFLFGMGQMSDGLKAAAGEQMKLILAKVTANRIVGAGTGAFVTAVIQSSSVTTVLVVGFISAGLMSMAQSVPVIMGANIGTTITAQIVAFKVTKIALPMIAVGFAMLSFAERERTKHFGAMLMGLGLVFFGMTVMGDAMAPLRTYQPFLDLMVTVQAPLIGILVGALFTALVQSSSATTGIVIVMATQGLITLPGGIAMAIGANIGTCITALLAALGKPREAFRAAAVHVLFNVAGGLLWVGLIGYLAQAAIWMSPTAEGLTGAQKLVAETPRQIANANTIFNVINTLLFLPFTTQIARIVERMIPDKPMVEKIIIEPKFLDEALIETPSLALDRVRLELGHMGERVKVMLEEARRAILERDRELLKEVRKLDDQVDILRDRIIEYLGWIGRQPLTEDQGKALLSAMTATDDLERIGDLIETDLVDSGNAIIEQKLTPSETTKVVLSELYQAAAQAVDAAIRAVAAEDQQAAHEVVTAKDEVDQLVKVALEHQAENMASEGPDRLAHHRIEVSLIDKLKRIHSLAEHISKLELPTAVLSEAS